MKKLLPKLLILSFLCTGCAAFALPTISPSFSGGGQQQLIQTTTTVQLNSENFRIVKTNAVGSDWGINLLGLIAIISPNYEKVMDQLCKAGEISAGKPQAIVNVHQQYSSPYFILFSIPRITVRADVVEFTKPGK